MNEHPLGVPTYRQRIGDEVFMPTVIVTGTYRDFDACPICGCGLTSQWADDGEADLADWFACDEPDGCGATGALVRADDITRTQNGIAV